MRRVLFLGCLILAGFGWLSVADAQSGGTELGWGQVGGDLIGQVEADFFGVTVATNKDGTRVAVGARGDLSTLIGSVQVFDWTASGWSQVGRTLEGESAGDLFSIVTLSADGNRLAVGAPGANSRTGLVKVFDWSGSAWVQVGASIDGAALWNFSGVTIELSADGSRLAIGARSDRGGGVDKGYVRVYDWSGVAWVQVGSSVDGADAEGEVAYLRALSGDGTRVAVGLAGRGQVYEWTGSVWEQMGPDFPKSGGLASLSFSGSRLAFNSVSGQQVLDWNGTTWEQVAADVASDFRHVTGVKLADDGSRLALASRASNQARVLDSVGGSWIQVGSTIHGGEHHDDAGVGLALSGDGSRVAIGALRINPPDKPGQVRVFEFGILCGGKAVTIDMNTNGGVGTGTTGNDVILGTPGDDVIRGFGGADTICGEAGRDNIRGGGAADTIFGGSEIDRIWGDGGDDVIYGDGGSDRIRAGVGNDTVMAGSGADRVWGGPGDDTLNGMGGQDFMWGEAGTDVMQGNFQSDRLRGGDGDDVIRGAGGKDKLYGEAGDDQLFGGNNTDYLDGGDGTDTADGQAGKDNPLVVDVSGCVAETLISC